MKKQRRGVAAPSKKPKMNQLVKFLEAKTRFEWPSRITQVPVSEHHRFTFGALYPVSTLDYYPHVITIETGQLQAFGLAYGDTVLLPLDIYRLLSDQEPPGRLRLGIPIIHIRRAVLSVETGASLFAMAAFFGHQATLATVVCAQRYDISERFGASQLTVAMQLVNTYAALSKAQAPGWLLQVFKSMSFEDLMSQDAGQKTVMHHAIALRCQWAILAISERLCVLDTNQTQPYLEYIDDQGFDYFHLALWHDQYELAESIFKICGFTMRQKMMRDLSQNLPCVGRSGVDDETYLRHFRRFKRSHQQALVQVVPDQTPYRWPNVPDDQAQKVVHPEDLYTGYNEGFDFLYRHTNSESVKEKDVELRTVWILNRHFLRFSNPHYGVFARCTIPAESFMGDYIGREICVLDGGVESFMLKRDDDAQIYLDATTLKSWTAFLNMGAQNNSNFVKVDSTGTISIQSTCDIRAGSQILVDYNTNEYKYFNGTHLFLHSSDDGLSPYELNQNRYHPCVLYVKTNELAYLGCKQGESILAPKWIYQLFTGVEVQLPESVDDLYLPIITTQQKLVFSDEFSIQDKINIFMLACHYSAHDLIQAILAYENFDINVPQYFSGLTGPMIMVSKLPTKSHLPDYVAATICRLSYQDLIQQDQHGRTLLHHALMHHAKAAKLILRQLIQLYKPGEIYYLDMLDDKNFDVFRVALQYQEAGLAMIMYTESSKEYQAQLIQELVKCQAELSASHKYASLISAANQFMQMLKNVQTKQSQRRGQRGSVFWGQSARQVPMDFVSGFVVEQDSQTWGGRQNLF